MTQNQSQIRTAIAKALYPAIDEAFGVLFDIKIEQWRIPVIHMRTKKPYEIITIFIDMNADSICVSNGLTKTTVDYTDENIITSVKNGIYKITRQRQLWT